MVDMDRSTSPLDWGARMLYGMQHLWRSGHLCDFTITIDDHCFPVHKAFLAAVSDYFFAMLTGGMRETYRDSVELKGVPESGLQPLLEYVYTGKLTLTTENACSVLTAAVYLQIQPAVHYCSRFLESAIHADNVLDILDVAKLYSLRDLKSSVMSYIARHFEQVAHHQGHVLLEYDELNWVLSNEDFVSSSELQVYKRVRQWLDYQTESRSIHEVELMRLIHFDLIQPTELEEISMEHRGAAWRGLVDKARQYHSLPSHLKVSVQAQESTAHMKPSIVAYPSYSFGRSTHSMYSLTPPRNEWQVHKNISKTSSSTYAGSAAVVNNFLIICGGFLNSQSGTDEVSNKCYLFDPKTFSWSDMAPMNIPRASFPLVSCNGFLFAIGGLRKIVRHTGGPSPAIQRVHTHSIERYNFKTNTWGEFSWSRHATKHHAACCLGNSIYMSGGELESEAVSDQMVCFDSVTKDWEPLQPLSEPASGHFMFPLQDRILVVGLDDEYDVHSGYGIEVYTPASDQWTGLFAGLLPRGAEVVNLQNDLYFINGWMEDEEDNDGMRTGISMKVTYEGGQLCRATPLNCFLDVDYPLCFILRLPVHRAVTDTPEDGGASSFKSKGKST